MFDWQGSGTEYNPTVAEIQSASIVNKMVIVTRGDKCLYGKMNSSFPGRWSNSYPQPKIQDITRVSFLYEIHEKSLRRVSLISYEMTTSVRFYLSYDFLKWDFVAFKMNIISMRKSIADMDVVSHVTCTRQTVITRVVIG